MDIIIIHDILYLLTFSYISVDHVFPFDLATPIFWGVSIYSSPPKKMPLVQATIEASTPVPQSFDQAVTWACSACLRAAEEGGGKVGNGWLVT